MGIHVNKYIKIYNIIYSFPLCFLLRLQLYKTLLQFFNFLKYCYVVYNIVSRLTSICAAGSMYVFYRSSCRVRSHLFFFFFWYYDLTYNCCCCCCCCSGGSRLSKVGLRPHPSSLNLQKLLPCPCQSVLNNPSLALLCHPSTWHCHSVEYKRESNQEV